MRVERRSGPGGIGRGQDAAGRTRAGHRAGPDGPRDQRRQGLGGRQRLHPRPPLSRTRAAAHLCVLVSGAAESSPAPLRVDRAVSQDTMWRGLLRCSWARSQGTGWLRRPGRCPPVPAGLGCESVSVLGWGWTGLRAAASGPWGWGHGGGGERVYSRMCGPRAVPVRVCLDPAPSPGPSMWAGLVFFLPDHESKTSSEEML